MKTHVHVAGLASYSRAEYDPVIGKVMLKNKLKKRVIRGDRTNIILGRQFWIFCETA